MNRLILPTSALFLLSWIYFLLMATGALAAPDFMRGLEAPSTMAELGDSLGVVNGFMSAFAAVIAFVTLAEQRRAAAWAKKEQDRAHQLLADQLIHQYRAMRQSYLVGEEARLQGILDRIEGDHRRADLWNNVVQRKRNVLRELKLLDQRLGEVK